ncbi:hypothetical protein MNBD_GAMMA10-1643 [hydrothermal vent metagenome]|uniref:Uncharacterized protein n=1 Tax=hydrothermal vent metagenome TaxID=652676 RepID=A0A3B0YA98_9ZZZZ
MQNKGLNLIVSEYNILWEALKHYEKRLEKISSMTTDENQVLVYDEKLQDIDGLLKTIKLKAKNDYDLDLS